MIKLWGLIAGIVLCTTPAALAQTKGSGSGSQTQSPVPSTPRQAAQPYAGQQTRAVHSLSDDEIADLEAGRGMGFALPAELSGYPGPLHVLELAAALQLTESQRARIQVSYDWMKTQAQGLGRQYIAAEKALTAAFRAGTIDATILAERIKAAEDVRSELRQVHLIAHIETAALLTARQKDIYEAQRGYGGQTPARGEKGSGSGSGSGSRSSVAPGRVMAAGCGGGTSGAVAAGCCCGGSSRASGSVCSASANATSCTPSR